MSLLGDMFGGTKDVSEDTPEVTEAAAVVEPADDAVSSDTESAADGEMEVAEGADVAVADTAGEMVTESNDMAESTVAAAPEADTTMTEAVSDVPMGDSDTAVNPDPSPETDTTT